MNTLILATLMIATLSMAGCASVPMASEADDAAGKTFAAPAADTAGVYIFRDSFMGKAVKRSVSLDGVVLGNTANKVYFYTSVSPGPHTVSTESEFGNKSVSFQAAGGHNYFVRQVIEMGVISAAANVEMVDDAEGEKEVRQCDRAQQQ